MAFADKTLTCRDCSADFVFTVGEQDFYEQKGFANAPTRCPECRAKFKALNRDGGRRTSMSAREMHSATCAGCGKEAQVPFVPSGEKPVYCSDCFKTQRPSRW